MKKKSSVKKNMGRMVAFLTRDEIDFIDKIAKDALFSTGHKLSRTDIIRAIIDAIKIREISAEGVSSRGELEKRLLAIMRMTLPAAFYELKKRRQAIREKNGYHEDI